MCYRYYYITYNYYNFVIMIIGNSNIIINKNIGYLLFIELIFNK